jgi:hypothetical protein
MNDENQLCNPPIEDKPEPAHVLWLRATPNDLASVDFEAPIETSKSADSRELGDLLRAAQGDVEDTPNARVFAMLSAVAGMAFKPSDRNEPFGAMIVWADGRRSAIPADFRGPALAALIPAAEKAKHPVLRARLSDLCWILDLKQGKLANAAIRAYVDVIKKVDKNELSFPHDQGNGVLKHDACDLLRRALQIGKAVGWDKEEAIAARETLTELRARAVRTRQPIPSLWFSELDLDFGVSDPAAVGKDIEGLIGALSAEADSHTIVELWRLAARAYHFARRENDKNRCRAAAAERLVLIAEAQPMAMIASSNLSDAILELHGLPGKMDRRKELRHRLVDIQAGISEEMSGFSHPLDLEDLIKTIEAKMRRPTLRDQLFVFAGLAQSPDPVQLTKAAAESMRKYPLASLFSASHHDHEGKVIHRTTGAGFGDDANASAVANQIAQDEGIRRQITAFGQIEVARQSIMAERFLSDDTFIPLFLHSPFVPRDLVRTFSRGFLRFFQGDYVSALYILTPLLENSLRHVLKDCGHDVSKFDDATQTQEDRTISSLFDQMRGELDAVFGKAITADIERLFLKKPGPYLRHSVSHGLLHDGDPYGHNAIYACWLIFHLCLLPLFPVRDQIQLPYDAPETETAEPSAPA